MPAFALARTQAQPAMACARESRGIGKAELCASSRGITGLIQPLATGFARKLCVHPQQPQQPHLCRIGIKHPRQFTQVQEKLRILGRLNQRLQVQSC